MIPGATQNGRGLFETCEHDGALVPPGVAPVIHIDTLLTHTPKIYIYDINTSSYSTPTIIKRYIPSMGSMNTHSQSKTLHILSWHSFVVTHIRTHASISHLTISTDQTSRIAHTIRANDLNGTS